jgi:NAD(P)-dependent dehydrogenase (short-subunit alcohol dehydrogenase family)
MPRKLRDSVVVITVASSGIGRATALRMAQAGATVVLAARSEQPLQQVVAECAKSGSRAIAVSTDVTDEAAVRALANRAVESLGRIDVWVNSAAVSVIARFEDMPAEALRRVIDTNLLGYVNGARAALACFREQGSGALINVSSQVALGGQPYASAYVMTKYAIRGLTDCLRQELLGTGIQVCTVLPGAVDTPIYTHAANYSGRAVKPLTPILDANRVAAAIAHLAEHPKHEIMIGWSGHFLSALRGLAPSLCKQPRPKGRSF